MSLQWTCIHSGRGVRPEHFFRPAGRGGPWRLRYGWCMMVLFCLYIQVGDSPEHPTLPQVVPHSQRRNANNIMPTVFHGQIAHAWSMSCWHHGRCHAGTMVDVMLAPWFTRDACAHAQDVTNAWRLRTFRSPGACWHALAGALLHLLPLAAFQQAA